MRLQVSGKNDAYCVTYDAQTGTIACEGTLDFRGRNEYGPVADLFEKVVEDAPGTIVLDIRHLEFLNSSGITVIGSGLIIKTRKKGVSRIQVHCSRKYAWQERSVKGLTKLMPDMELIFDE